MTFLATPMRPALPPAMVRYFVADWRRSPITATRPDPNAAIADTDMNSWERFNPAIVTKTSPSPAVGYSVYRATFSVPRILQKTGGRMIFHGVAREFTAYLNGDEIAVLRNPPAIPFGPTDQKLTLSLLVQVRSTAPALTGPVELVAL